MQQQLSKNKSSTKIIMKDKVGNAAMVRSNNVFLYNDFNNNLCLETFRDVLHESKHIIDKKLSTINLILVYFSGILLTILLIIYSLFIYQIIIHNTIHNNLITLLRSIISIIIMLLFSVQTMIHITLENNAIRYVVINCNDKLKNLGFENAISRKIHDYLSLQACYISEWYTMNLIADLFLIYGLLIFIGF